MYATHEFYMLPQHTPTLPLQRGMKTQLGWILQASCRFQNHATSCTQCNLDSSQFLQLPVEKGKVLSLMHLNAFSDLTHDYVYMAIPYLPSVRSSLSFLKLTSYKQFRSCILCVSRIRPVQCTVRRDAYNL